MEKYNMIELPKGGLVIDTAIGAIQLGAPPETIKDSLALGRDVPSYYIAPKNLFSYKKMASIMDMEFPCYFNFFVLSKKTRVFCTEEQRDIIYELVKESVFGPKRLNLEMEFAGGRENPLFPDMEREMEYFVKHPSEDRTFTMDDIIELVILEENFPLEYEGVSFLLNSMEGTIKVSGELEIELDWDIDYRDIDSQIMERREIFIPPSFGITTLGSSHGFDPKGKTSGFIFWINGVGIMVDPPVDSALWLIEENVDPRMVNSVILTHCHSDHDSGLMQKVLQEGRVTLYTTATIFSSFVKKVSLLTGLNEIDIVQLIDFVPIMIDSPFNINGAMLTFSYRLHSIPTIGFEVNFKDRSVVYTSDHLNDQSYFDSMREMGVLTEGRYRELSGFDWDKDIIIHEAGIPPLHTPLETMLKLPERYKKNIYLVHTDKSKLPPDSGLKLSPTGLSNTMVIDAEPTVHGESIQILNIVTSLDIFQEIPFFKAAEFLSIVSYIKFNPGDCLIRQGDINERFFIIIAGRAQVFENGVKKTVLSSGSYFGENSIISESTAYDTIYALTELVSIVIDKREFLRFISNTPIFERLKKLSKVRKYGSWETIEANSFFKTITINQKNNLESLFNYCTADSDEIIIKSGKTLEHSLFWHSGEAVVVGDDNREIKNIGMGDFIGNPRFLLGEQIPDFSLIAKTPSSYFSIDWNEMLKFFQNNPRILLELRNRASL